MIKPKQIVSEKSSKFEELKKEFIADIRERAKNYDYWESICLYFQRLSCLQKRLNVK